MYQAYSITLYDLAPGLHYLTVYKNGTVELSCSV
jgi:hypothetical protein